MLLVVVVVGVPKIVRGSELVPPGGVSFAITEFELATKVGRSFVDESKGAEFGVCGEVEGGSGGGGGGDNDGDEGDGDNAVNPPSVVTASLLCD